MQAFTLHKENRPQPATSDGRMDALVNPLQMLGAERISRSERNNPFQLAESAASNIISGQLIAEDDAAEIDPSQLKRSTFLQQLYDALYKTGTEAYEHSNLTVDGCPVIARWFDHYRGQSAASIETAARRYTRATGMMTATELIEKVCERAKSGFQKQAETGEVGELPDEVPSAEVKSKLPTPQMVLQGKFTGNPLSAEVIQLGSCAPKLREQKVPMKGCVTVTDNVTRLTTSGFGGCVGVILLAPNNRRTLAHIYSGDIDNPEQWNQVDTFKQEAARATVAHVYHLGIFSNEDSEIGKKFFLGLGLSREKCVFHGEPPIVEVDHLSQVTD